MSDHSAIQWTDATWNPTTGCTKVSPGCAHCYIERTPAFRIAGRKFVDGRTDLRLHVDRLEQPLHWRKPRRVFVNSLSDLFHPDIPDAFIDQVFAVMALAPQHTFQVLTKRPERMRAYFSNYTEEPLHGEMRRLNLQERIDDAAGNFGACHANVEVADRWPLPNVWLGISVENQHFADQRIPLLLQTPAAVRFISAEPLLGPVNLQQFVPGYSWGKSEHPMDAPLDWVIVGGESGPRSRPFDIAWARLIVAQCKAAGVACFVKQLGDVPVMAKSEWRATHPTRLLSPRNHRKVARDVVRLQCYRSKGGDPAEWPEDLRVRQFPEVTVG